MRTYRRTAHTVYELHYHIGFSTKYRKPVLKGEIATDVRALIREICRSNDIEILAGHVRRTTCTCCSACRRTWLRAA
ncbi:MAG: transposase [Deltaproteobacteria bacterium]|nr:transposase [Deltaproteobacteria bacterium]